MTNFSSGPVQVVDPPVPPIERLSLYDYPGVYIDNAIRGRVFQAGLNPARMSPNDRLEVADRIKQDLGIDNPVIGTAIEIATNPWVWLATAGSMIFKLGSIGRSAATLFTPAHRHMVEVRKRGPILGELVPVFGAREELMGSPLIRVLDDITEARRRFHSGQTPGTRRLARVEEMRSEIVRGVEGARRLSDIDGGRLNRAIQAKLAGLDQDRVEVVAEITRAADGTFSGVKSRRVQMGAMLDERALDGYLRNMGAEGLVRETRALYNDMFEELYGVAGKRGEVDPNKVLRIFRGYQHPVMRMKNLGLEQGIGVHSNLLSDDIAEAVANGTMSRADFESFVRESVPRQAFYAPMNSSRFYRKTAAGGLQEVGFDEYGHDLSRTAQAMRPTGSAVTRRADRVFKLWDVADLESLEVFARGRSRENFNRVAARSRDQRAKVVGGPLTAPFVRFNSLDFEQSMSRHVTQSARTHALYTGGVAEETAAFFNANLKRIEEAAEQGLGVYEDRALLAAQKEALRFDKGVDGRQRAVFEGIGEEGAPAGGFSNADVLRANYELVPGADPTGGVSFGTTSSTLKRSIAEVYVPVALGRMDLNQGILTSLVQNTKFRAKDWVDRSGVAKALRESGGLGRSVVSKIEAFADEPIRSPQAFDAGLARAFYGGTLGANLATIIVNSTQPALTTSRFVSAEDLARGYFEAFKDLGKYASERARTPGLLVGPQGERTLAGLVRRNFRYADEASIGTDVVELELRQRARGPRSERVGVGGVFANAQDVLLKGFQTGEMVNRSVTAHALAARAAREGLSDAETRRLIREGVSATQFASEPLATPRIFLGDSGPFPVRLDNPIFRQFLTFPTRMTTGLLRSVPLAKSEGQGLARAQVLDGLRAMGVSAAVYEAGKELFGADLSYATLTGAALTGVFREYGPGAPLPLPPAVTLPLSVIQAMQEGDLEAMRFTLPTLLPGGVAATRALGLAPRTPLADVGGIQRSYVDYTRRTRDGRYPVMTPDGRVVSYETLTALMARASGVDMGRFRDESEMIGYLQRIREDTLEARRAYLTALTGNDLPAAQRVAKAYEGKFGVPLRVNQQQIKSFRDIKERSRLERTFDTLPREVKDALGGSVGASIDPRRLGLDPGSFERGVRAADRTRAPGVELPTDVRQIVEREMQAAQQRLQQQGQPVDRGFAPYTPFGRTP